MNIFLVGFMGSGKSTLGKKIAQQLNYSFIDVDKDIETSQHKSISGIFESSSEDAFRRLEKKWLHDYAGENTVIATGGGMPCFNSNLSEMKKKGKLVFIDLPVEALADRLLASKTKRPLLEKLQGNRDAIILYIKESLANRLTYYQQSDFTLNGLNLNGDKIKQFAELLLKSESTSVKRENKN